MASSVSFQNQVADFIKHHSFCISAFLYLAHCNMPHSRAQKKRRAEIIRFILLAIGYQSTAEQIAERTLETIYRSLKRTEAINISQLNNKSLSFDKQLYDIEVAKNWLYEHDNLFNQLDNFLLSFKNPIQSENDFILAVNKAKIDSKIYLSNMLSTIGNILVHGTPDVINNNPAKLSSKELELAKKMKDVWNFKES